MGSEAADRMSALGDQRERLENVVTRPVTFVQCRAEKATDVIGQIPKRSRHCEPIAEDVGHRSILGAVQPAAPDGEPANIDDSRTEPTDASQQATQPESSGFRRKTVEPQAAHQPQRTL